MKICIIGAGVAGLVSAKYGIEEGHEVVVYEQTGHLGGTWHYTDEVGLDENGIPVHSSMYKNLKTNLPKEVMTLHGLAYKEKLNSYIKQTDVLEYLQNYAGKFDLVGRIQFYKRVVDVKPLPGDKWIVTVMDCRSKERDVLEFDAVMVCNGHYFHAVFPKIDGMNTFQGKQIHSKDFRKPEVFEGQTVTVIGAGPSGVDIAKQIASSAKTVYLSHKMQCWKLPVLPNIVDKPEVSKIDAKGCLYVDSSYEKTDVIVYCTGYNYSFPFLSAECGISVDDNWIKYLHRHVINVEHPTMCFIGIVFSIPVFLLTDLSARYFYAYLSKKFTLPDKEAMIRGVQEAQLADESTGWPRRHAHKARKRGFEIARGMEKEANLEPIPNVLFKLHNFISEHRNLADNFKIIDDETYIKLN